MKLSLIVTGLLIILIPSLTFSQQSGNVVIGKSHNYSRSNHQLSVDKLYLNDSSFVVQANVLKNVIADSYVATFGVSEASSTLIEANSKIDKRISDFVSALLKLGVTKDDIYVDMTTQTLISDYKVSGNYAEQYISGFEQKKNVVIKFDNIKLLDRMIVLASDYGIYDLAKVDYIVLNINKLYTELFTAAVDVIQEKKTLYAKATNVKLLPGSQIYGESFYSIYPAELYKSYTPNISTEYYSYSSYSKRKDLRKNTTYFYDKVNYSGFDKVINPVVTEPAVEIVLKLQIKFDIKK